MSERKKIKIFMRVKNPAETVRINFKDDKGKVLASYKKKIVTPGEMLNFYLPEILLTEQLKSITVSIK